MTPLHVTNDLNVVASLNQYITDGLAAITKPTWLPDYEMVYTIPEAGVPTPSYSIHHYAVMTTDIAEGRQVGGGEVGLRSHGLMDVSIWVSRGNDNWLAQQLTMKAMLKQVIINGAVVVLSDYSTPASPSAVAYKVHITGMDGLDTVPDLNPDMERSRFVITYNWVQRS